MVETVEKALEAKGLLSVPHSGARHARAVVMVEPGGARHVRADAVGLGEVPVRLPEMSVGAEEVGPSAMLNPLLVPMMTKSASASARPMRTAFAVSMRYLPSVLRTSASTSAMSARTASPQSSIAQGRNCVLLFTAM